MQTLSRARLFVVGTLVTGLGMAAVSQADEGGKPELTPEGIAKRETEKSAYTLFNRTPDSMLRELTPDRPDKTESPYSVDAGHFQIEADWVNYTKNQTLYGNILAKAGLTRTMDLQLGFSPVVVSKVEGSTETSVSDLTVRLKWNLIGNEGGDLAVGLLPFVTFPTSGQGSKLSGGLSFPTGYGLPYGFEGGAMATFEFGDESGLSTMATFGHDLVGPLGGYVEFFNKLPKYAVDGWEATLDLGLTYGLSEHVQLDAGVNLGITTAAESANVFTGITARF